MIVINFIGIVTYILGEDCSHTTTLIYDIYDIEGAINNGYTATLLILVSRTKIFPLSLSLSL